MNPHTFRKTALATAISAACLTSALNAVAQTDDTELEEILVTATAREQSVQDIPYNISAISGNDITAKQIAAEAELFRSFAGISAIDRGERNAGTVNSIIIRGLNVDSGTAVDNATNTVAPVSTYVDNTPLYARFVLKDIQRVEVLRGPQATLYGSGALGGTVRYITNKPNPENFEAEISADYSQTNGSDGNNMNLNLMLNVPLGDRLAIRGHVGRIDNDGAIDYINAYQLNSFREPLVAVGGDCVDPRQATDQQVLYDVACFTNEEDADTVEIDYARIAMKFDATDALSFLLSYQTQEDDIGSRRAITLGDNGQPAGSALFFEYGDDDNGRVLLEPSTREIDMYALDMEWDLGFATLTSNSSKFEHEGLGERDNGAFWTSGGRDFSSWLYPGWARPAHRTEGGFEEDTFIQEVRLVSNETDGNFDWLAGVFYIDQDKVATSNSWNPGMNNWAQACARTDDPVCAGFWPYLFFPGVPLTENDFEYIRNETFEELAIYGEMTWHVADKWHITGGIRWFDNESVSDGVMGFPLVDHPALESPTVDTFSDKDNDVLLKLNVSYNISDSTMFYGTVSEGYRRGGTNAVPSLEDGDVFGEPNADAIKTFDKDSVINYEIGVKGRTERFTYTLTGFYLDWSDPQLNTATAWYGFLMADNGDSAHTMGIEAEINGYLTDSLHYYVGYSWVEAELDSDFHRTQDGAVVAIKGTTLPGTPQNMLSLGLDNTWSLNDGMDLVGQINGYYQDESENFLDNESPINEIHDSFFLLGASVSLLMDNWRVTLYGRNLTDEEGATGSFPSSFYSYDTGIFEGWYGNGNIQMITQPRTIGLVAAYKF